MNHALAALIVITPMLTACLNDEPRIVQVPAAPMVAPIQAEERVVQVISAIPNYQVPQQQCHTENVPVEYEEQVSTPQEVTNDEPRQQSVGGALLGGAIGAGLTSLVGGPLVLVGLIGGMAAGDHLGGSTPPATKIVTVMKAVTRTRYEQQEKCETASEPVVENYTVTFIYKGQPVTTVMSYNPGPNLVLGMGGNAGQ